MNQRQQSNTARRRERIANGGATLPFTPKYECRGPNGAVSFYTLGQAIAARDLLAMHGITAEAEQVRCDRCNQRFTEEAPAMQTTSGLILHDDCR